MMTLCMYFLLHFLLCLIFVVPALYYFVFAVAGKSLSAAKNIPSRQSRFCVLIPAYRSDSYIMPTVQAALNQKYPSDKFRVLVISDGMQKSSVENILHSGAEVLEVAFANSTKAASLAAAMDYLGRDAGDYVVILDSDNIVEPDFLCEMNAVLDGRRIAVQGHRCAKNADTPVAVADGIFEQVNNLVFRAGHCALGLSSALIGSGMAFPYDWFRGCARDFETAGEDKEMELRLLMDGIFVEYAPHIHILDEKARIITNLQKQRRRWLHSQYALIVNAIAEFPFAKFKAGYADKLLQWLFIPRILLITGLPLLAILSIFTSSIWWLYLLATIMLFAAICLGLPAGVKIKDLAPVLNQVPAMALATLRNIFGKKTASDEFIHTDHENSN